MKTNIRTKAAPTFTHEGAVAARLSSLQQLRRSTMACMLWEDTFYEDGQEIGKRIQTLSQACSPEAVAELAIEIRREMGIRHAPLLLATTLIGRLPRKQFVSMVDRVTKRADDTTELLSIYWKLAREAGKAPRKGRHTNAPVAKSLAKALGNALLKFDSYQLSKYAARGDIRLRDVLRITRAKPTPEREALWKHLYADTLPTADTWESRLSGGQDKKAAFEGLLAKGSMGGFAILRNLRNMDQAGVPKSAIRGELLRLAPKSGILPFQFIGAAKAVPKWEDMIEEAMFASLATFEKLKGRTALVVDHSNSMNSSMSSKSTISHFEAAAALGMMLREVSEECRVFTYSDRCVEVPPRRGFGLLEAMNKVRNPVSTYLGRAVKYVYEEFPECDRVIVVTDEQSADKPPKVQGTGYIVNVSSDKPSIAHGEWVSLTGFSENLIRYIQASEEKGG